MEMSVTIATKDEVSFRTARRVNQALTASAEKRALQWMAERAPQWVSSDQLTVLGLSAQIAAGVCYTLSRYDRRFLLLVIVCIVLNWLGDSLTLARVRGQQRPRYGFYVDHMVDILGTVALMCGLGFSGFLHWQTAIAMLVAFLILSSESYLATYTLSCFPAFARLVWSYGDTDPADCRQSGFAAQSVFDVIRASDAAVRSGRNDRGSVYVRDCDLYYRAPYG